MQTLYDEDIPVKWHSLTRRVQEQTRDPKKRKSAKDHLVQILGGECKECHSTEDLALDHKVSLSLDGLDCVDNLQVLCWKCHKKKTRIDRQKIAFYRRILRRRCAAGRNDSAEDRAKILSDIDYIVAHNIAEKERSEHLTWRGKQFIIKPNFGEELQKREIRRLLREAERYRSK